MSGLAELRLRADSIKDTKKVTDAMYMISSVKVRRAKQDVDSTRPYFSTLREEIGSILHYLQADVVEMEDVRLTACPVEAKSYGLTAILFCADRSAAKPPLLSGQRLPRGRGGLLPAASGL